MPLTVREVVSRIHAFVERFVLDCSVNVFNCVGHEMRTRLFVIRLVMLRNGSGHTVVAVVTLLLAGLISVESEPTDARLLIVPIAVGFTVKTIVAEL